MIQIHEGKSNKWIRFHREMNRAYTQSQLNIRRKAKTSHIPIIVITISYRKRSFINPFDGTGTKPWAKIKNKLIVYMRKTYIIFQQTDIFVRMVHNDITANPNNIINLMYMWTRSKLFVLNIYIDYN